MTLNWSRIGERSLGARRVAALSVGLLGALALLGLGAAAQESAYRGVDIVDAACSACHTNGEEGAPRIGDRVAWSKRIASGRAGLTPKMVESIRSTAAHDGSTSLSRLEFERAVVYMINAAGGNWAEPAGAQRRSVGNAGAQIAQSHCALCHAGGFDGAPRIGDRAAWLPRTKLGLDRLVRAASLGHGAMPPRGGEVTLSDAELRSAIIYMIGSGQPAPRGGR